MRARPHLLRLVLVVITALGALLPYLPAEAHPSAAPHDGPAGPSLVAPDGCAGDGCQDGCPPGCGSCLCCPCVVAAEHGPAPSGLGPFPCGPLAPAADRFFAEGCGPSLYHPPRVASA